MYKQLICRSLLLLCLAAMGCKAPSVVLRDARKSTPAHYGQGADSSNSAALPWRSFFADPDLVRLIDTALKNNQELLIALQEIEIARSEARLRQGPLLPKVRARVGAGLEKVG
ncbi:MAG: TolC family protein, partial [Chitinophagaceae bacterium]